MAKLQLKPAPTFVGKVSIPVAGAEPATISFTFKHRTRDALNEWLRGGKDRKDLDAIMECTTGWDLDEPHSRESVAELVQNYIGAPAVVVNFYIEELTRAKLGN